jgi:hypothetical protein
LPLDGNELRDDFDHRQRWLALAASSDLIEQVPDTAEFGENGKPFRLQLPPVGAKGTPA